MADLVLDNAWHYLFEPSTATQARQAAQFAYTRLGGPRTAVVLYEDTKDEEAFGLAYKQAYEALGGKVLQLRRINSDDETSLAAGFAGIDLKTIGHLVVASDNPKAGRVHALGAAGAERHASRSSPTPPGSTTTASASTSSTPATCTSSTPSTSTATTPGCAGCASSTSSSTTCRLRCLPTSASSCFITSATSSTSMARHSSSNWPTGGPVSGAVFQGIGYPEGAHDNQYVPITKLERLEVEVLNPVGFR